MALTAQCGMVAAHGRQHLYIASFAILALILITQGLCQKQSKHVACQGDDDVQIVGEKF